MKLIIFSILFIALASSYPTDDYIKFNGIANVCFNTIDIITRLDSNLEEFFDQDCVRRKLNLQEDGDKLVSVKIGTLVTYEAFGLCLYDKSAVLAFLDTKTAKNDEESQKNFTALKPS